jgi:hypothetical protein
MWGGNKQKLYVENNSCHEKRKSRVGKGDMEQGGEQVQN